MRPSLASTLGSPLCAMSAAPSGEGLERGGEGRAGAAGGEAASEGLSSYRVLLVDDDPATLMAMKHHLVRMRGLVKYEGASAVSADEHRPANSRRLSLPVTTADSAADALELLKEDPSSYDLVLTGA